MRLQYSPPSPIIMSLETDCSTTSSYMFSTSRNWEKSSKMSSLKLGSSWRWQERHENTPQCLLIHFYPIILTKMTSSDSHKAELVIMLLPIMFVRKSCHSTGCPSNYWLPNLHKCNAHMTSLSKKTRHYHLNIFHYAKNVGTLKKNVIFMISYLEVTHEAWTTLRTYVSCHCTKQIWSVLLV